MTLFCALTMTLVNDITFIVIIVKAQTMTFHHTVDVINDTNNELLSIVLIVKG